MGSAERNNTIIFASNPGRRSRQSDQRAPHARGPRTLAASPARPL